MQEEWPPGTYGKAYRANTESDGTPWRAVSLSRWLRLWTESRHTIGNLANFSPRRGPRGLVFAQPGFARPGLNGVNRTN